MSFFTADYIATHIEPITFGVLVGMAVTIIIAFFMMRLIVARAVAAKDNDHIRTLSNLEFSEKMILELKEELSAKDDLITELQAVRARLETSLHHERDMIEKNLKTIEAAKQDLSNMFKALSQEALQTNNKAFLDLAKENLEKMHIQSREDLEKKEKAIEQLVKPVSESLSKIDQKINHLEKERVGAYEQLKEHLSHMAADQVKLRGETSQLVRALRAPTTKGRWGEIHLKNTVKMAGMVEHVDFVEQDSFKDEGKLKRPDMVVHMPGGQKIIVDAKAPVDAYYDLLADNITPEKRDEGHARLARLVRDHVKGLASKSYWDQFESPEFVIMFLPNEGFFSAAVEKDPGLLEFSIEQKVIPASPTTLVALLRAVAYGWQQEKLAENAREISDLGAQLYERLATFGEHLQKMGGGLNNALGAYNKAIGSLEGSVLPAARKFKDLHVTTKKKEIPNLAPIETMTRGLNAPELLVSDDDVADSKKKKH